MCTYPGMAAQLLTRVHFVDNTTIGSGNPQPADTGPSDSSPLNNVPESAHVIII